MFITRMLRIVLTLIATLIAMPSFATIISVVVNPDPVGINTQGTSYITLNYTIVVTAPGVTVSSTSGTVLVDAIPVAVPGGPISQVVPLSGSTTVRMRERIRITRDVAAQIAQGTSTVFQRQFSDGSTAVFAINVGLIPSSSGALSFRNVALNFDDLSRFRTISQNGAITALMRLTTNGKGLLEGNWEVSNPASPSSFYPVGRVRQPLSGARALVIESPTLPTTQLGIYTVRFVPSGPPNPQLVASFPEIQYSVLPSNTTGTIDLRSPPADVNIGAATVFSWQGVSNSAGYRVEFLSLAAGSLNSQATRVAAVDVTGSQTSVQLKPFTLARIHAARTDVYWRILALDDTGTIIATSSIRPIGD